MEVADRVVETVTADVGEVGPFEAQTVGLWRLRSWKRLSAMWTRWRPR